MGVSFKSIMKYIIEEQRRVIDMKYKNISRGLSHML